MEESKKMSQENNVCCKTPQRVVPTKNTTHLLSDAFMASQLDLTDEEKPEDVRQRELPQENHICKTPQRMITAEDISDVLNEAFMASQLELMTEEKPKNISPSKRVQVRSEQNNRKPLACLQPKKPCLEVSSLKFSQSSQSTPYISTSNGTPSDSSHSDSQKTELCHGEYQRFIIMTENRKSAGFEFGFYEGKDIRFYWAETNKENEPRVMNSKKKEYDIMTVNKSAQCISVIKGQTDFSKVFALIKPPEVRCELKQPPPKSLILEQPVKLSSGKDKTNEKCPNGHDLRYELRIESCQHCSNHHPNIGKYFCKICLFFRCENCWVKLKKEMELKKSMSACDNSL
ncbi:MAG: hypothetical protein ACQUHE_17350 [Bacteroidia bacterium]